MELLSLSELEREGEREGQNVIRRHYMITSAFKDAI